MRPKARAFTLIELLVVIAIIGLLSSIVITSLNTARAKAADAQRMASVKQIQQALELFFQANGRYPGHQDPGMSSYATAPYNGAECGYQNDWCDLEAALAPYIGSLPRDTGSANMSDRRYVYKRNALRPDLYGLAVALETSNAASVGDGGYYTQLYEVGSLLQYCKQSYSGSNANWMNWNGSSLCVGGN